MIISSAALFFAVLVIIYYAWKYRKMQKLATYMRDIPSEKDSLLCNIYKHSHNHNYLAEGFEEIFSPYTAAMCRMYAETGPFNDGSRQYLYAMSKVHISYDFVCITLFKFISDYTDEHFYDLTDYKNGKHYKNELCKKLDEVYLCVAKECTKIKDINKIYPVYIENVERYAVSETIEHL